MNTLVLIRMAATVAASLLLAFNVHAGGEVKKVCRMEKDKTGKEKEVCRDVKVHKKLEGKSVPGQK
jgi:hypothetical protein